MRGFYNMRPAKTFEEFLSEWVNKDPENEGLYTITDIRIAYDQYLVDYENE